MNKQLCYCINCKGINVSKKTFRRHLLKENQLNFHIKPKQKITKKHDEYIDIYSNQSLSNELDVLSSDNDIIATTSYNTKAKRNRSIPSISILQENNLLDMNSLEAEFEFDYIASKNDNDFTEMEIDYITVNGIDKVDSDNENSDEEYNAIKTNYNLINIDYNPPILDTNETTKWVILWIYLFQDTFMLSQTANGILLDFFRKILQSFNKEAFLDFPSTIYRADRSLGIEIEYKNYIVCPQCHHLYLLDILNKNQHIKCKCNEIITKMIRTSKGNHLIKVQYTN